MTWLIGLMLLGGIGLAGCQALPPPKPQVPELSALEILSRLKARHADLQSFALRGRLTLISPNQNATGTAYLKVRFPQSLRVDLKDPLGRTVLNFATDGQTVELLFPREGKLFRGPATPANLAAFIPPGVSLPQALSLLAGKVPFSPEPSRDLYLHSRERDYIMEWRNGDGSLRERLTISGDDLNPRREEWYGDQGRLVFAADLNEFDPQVPGRPKRLRLVTQAPRVELRLAYQEFTANVPLNSEDLRLPRPPGVVEYPLKP